MRKSKLTADIGIDFTEEDEEFMLKLHREKRKKTPKEEEKYLKMLRETIEASKHPQKLL